MFHSVLKRFLLSLLLIFNVFIVIINGFNQQHFFQNDCCMFSSPNYFQQNNPNNIPIDEGVFLIRNSRDVFPANFYRSSNSFTGVVEPQPYGYGQFNQQQQHQQPSSPNLNPFQANNFDAHSWAQANANLFQQQQSQHQQQSNAFSNQIQPHPQPQTSFGAPTNNNNFGQSQMSSVQTATGYGGQPPSAYLPQQNIHQTYYPFNPTDNGNVHQQPAPAPAPVPVQTNAYRSISEEANQGFFPQQPQPDSNIYSTQQVVQQPNYNSYPQSPFPAPEPEAPAQPTIDNINLQQYAQYLEILQKQYGIKLPSAGSSALPTVQQETPNPYASAVQPQTQTHVQSQLQPGLQGTYPQQSGENAWNPWQNTNNNNFNNYQNQVKPIVTTYVPRQPAAPVPQPQIQVESQQQQNYEVYQPHPSPTQPQPFYQGGTDYTATNAVIEQPQVPHVPQQPHQPPPAPHIIYPSLPESVQQPHVPQPQTHVVIQPEVSIPRPQPQQPPPQPKPQPTIYISPPTHPTYPSPPPTTQSPPTRPSLEYEREIVTTTHQPRPSPATPSTTSIQALTQQIRRLPAVLYVDSRNPDTKRTETLLRETYGLPLVAFYVDKIDKPKAVERHLHQLTAHKGLPYLFICGTFIGSQQHIDNYHANRQVPQLVEFVCSDEKRKHKKKAVATSALNKE